MMNYIALHTTNVLIKIVSDGGDNTGTIKETASFKSAFLKALPIIQDYIMVFLSH